MRSLTYPSWMKVQLPVGEKVDDVRRIVRRHALTTVCEDAYCPNRSECWGRLGTATFMILGDQCTRTCSFCAVSKGSPKALDITEPQRVADAIVELKLRHAVITSVDRDDLPDGGAAHFAQTVRAIRRRDASVKIELLTPDFQGSETSLHTVLESAPDIFSHNMETVRRLYPSARPKSDYAQSFQILRTAKSAHPERLVKTGLMVGLGETHEELEQFLRHAAEARIDILTIGQYLRPSTRHAPMARYYSPDEFIALRQLGQSLGLRWIFAGPLVRSSFHAEDVFAHVRSEATSVQ